MPGPAAPAGPVSVGRPTWHTERVIDRSRLGLALLTVAAGLALFTTLALVVLWPGGGVDIASPSAIGQTHQARVVSVVEGACIATPVGDGGAADDAARTCRRVGAQVQSGPDAGQQVSFDVGGGFDVGVGDRIKVAPTGLPPDAQVGGRPADLYSFADFSRTTPLLWLALVFVVLVLATSRLRGLRALAGLGISLGVVVMFVVPAILDGAHAPTVAVVGALAIMLATIPLTHGLGPKALAALFGTCVALLLTVILATIAVEVAHITGFASEEAGFLNASGGEALSLQGLLVAGIVIGALGVLDDLTVSQASTVMALRHANPSLGASELFRRGMSVGHDHIVAMVNTLVLAYAGAALPVLLVFSVVDVGLVDAINSEVVAAEIVATLVGSIGLIAAAPITTGLAAALAARIDPATLRTSDHHGHSH